MSNRLSHANVEVAVLRDTPISLRLSHANVEVLVAATATTRVSASQVLVTTGASTAAPARVTAAQALVTTAPVATTQVTAAQVLVTTAPVATTRQTAVQALVTTAAPAGFVPTELKVKKLTFQKPTATGLQTITSVGFRGTALLIWSDRQTTPGLSTGAQQSIGMATEGQQATRFIHHPGGEASTTSAQSEYLGRLVFMTNATNGPTPLVQVAATFVEFTLNGFTIDWQINDATPALFHVLVIGGVEAALTSTQLTGGAGSTYDVTGLGFEPEAFVTMGGAANEASGFYNLGAPFGSVHGFGFSNSVEEMCGWTLGRGTGGASDNYRGQHVDRAASIRTANLAGAQELCAYKITDILADGYRITRTVSTSGIFTPLQTPYQHIIALRGAKFGIGAFSTPATPSTVVLPTSGTPVAALLQTHGMSAGVYPGLGMAIGAWEATGQGGTWIGGDDNVSPSVYNRASYIDTTLRAYTPHPSAPPLLLDGAISGVAVDQVSVAFATVPPTPVEILYLTIAPGAGYVPPPPAQAAQWFTGFGIGSTREAVSGANLHVIDDVRNAMGGRWYLKRLIKGGTATSGGFQRQLADIGTVPGATAVGRIACHLRIHNAGFADQPFDWAEVLGFEDGSSGPSFRLNVRHDGMLRHGTALGGELGTEIYRITFGQIYYVRWEVRYTVGNPSTKTLWLRLYDPSATTLLFEHAWSLTQPQTNHRLGYPTLGGYQSQVESAHIDYANFWCAMADTEAVAATVPFPTSIYVLPLYPTGQVAGSTWSGDYRLVDDFPFDANSDQTTSTAGAITDFTHEQSGQIGLENRTPGVISIPTTEFVHKLVFDETILPPDFFEVWPWNGPSQIGGLRGLYATHGKLRGGVRYEGWLTPVKGLDASLKPNQIWGRITAKHPPDSEIDKSFIRLYYFNCGVGPNWNEWFNPHITYQGLRSLVPDTTAVIARFKEVPLGSLVGNWTGQPPNAPGPPDMEGWWMGDTEGVNFLETRTGSVDVPTGAPLVIRGVKVGCNLVQLSGSGTQKLRIGTTEYDIEASSAYATAHHDQQHIEWTTRSLPEIDALTMGLRSLDTTPKALANCWMEILVDAPMPVVRQTLGYRHTVGSYSGNGAFSTIEVGFQPDFVIVFPLTGMAGGTAASARAWFQKTAFLVGISGTKDGNGLRGFTPSGFEVGLDPTVNASGGTYAYLAIRDGGQQAGGPLFSLDTEVLAHGGTTLGAVQSGRLQPPLGVGGPFVPNFMLMLAGSIEISTAWYAQGNETVGMSPAGNPLAGGVVSVSDKALTYGDNVWVSDSGRVGHQWAFRPDPFLVAHTGQGTGTGAGATTTVAGLPFGPALVVVTDASGSAYVKTTAHVGANATPWSAAGLDPTRILSLNADGFTISSGLVAVGERFWWFAFDPNAVTVPPDPGGVVPPPTGVDPPGEGQICAGGGLKLQPGPGPGAHGCTSC